jgi:hypothetical protein
VISGACPLPWIQKSARGWIATNSRPQVIAARVILGIKTEESDRYDFEFLTKLVPPYRRFFSDPSSSSSSSSSMLSSSSSSSPSSSSVSGSGRNTYSGKIIASAHQCTSSRCTECVEARAAGFEEDEERLIHHEPRPSLIFSSSLVSTANQFKNRGISFSSDSVTAPTSITLEPIGSLNQWASEIIRPWIPSRDPRVLI